MNPDSSLEERKREVEGEILLHIRVGDISVRSWFGAVTILAFQLLQGRSFIDRLLKGIFPRDRRIVPQYSKPY